MRRFRFGSFEADAALGELRKKGIRIKLNAQPFQVLTMLLERPGELLTREEISRELWPDGTFVDYDHGVNSAVNRIREALGDTAANPRFVETLARRGYRFVAPVERVVAVPQVAPDVVPVASPVPAIPFQKQPEVEVYGGLLAAPHELPKTSPPVVRGLYVGLQVMYVAFYVGALANLAEIEELMSPLPWAGTLFVVMIVTAAVLIPVRAFLLSAVFMQPPGARAKLLKVWQFLVAFDLLWAMSPFLLLHHINFGLAVASMALLVYAPFAQRSLVLMGAADAV